MKRLLSAGIALLLVITLLAVPSPIRADSGSCQSGPIGTVFSFTFSGFSPNKYVNAYLVEPDGTAVNGGSFKTSSSGSVSVSMGTHFGDATLGLGKWQLVVEEHANGKVVVHQAIGCFTVTGGTEGVSGATLTSSQSLVHPNESFVVSGSGFAPFEIVSLWSGRPTPCSSFTAHYVDGKNGATYENIPVFGAYGSAAEFDMKADASGRVFTSVSFGPGACSGVWNLVARGNSSKKGDSAEVTLVGYSVANTASLVASQESVNPFNDTILFHATGFGANDTLNCWTTSPEGRAIPYGTPGSFQTGFKTGPDGSTTISLTTGSHLLSPDDPFAPFLGTFDPQMSEGSLGVWSMSCNGLPSGKIGIARFCLGPCVLPPVGKESNGEALPARASEEKRGEPCQGLICPFSKNVSISSP